MYVSNEKLCKTDCSLPLFLSLLSANSRLLLCLLLPLLLLLLFLSRRLLLGATAAALLLLLLLVGQLVVDEVVQGDDGPDGGGGVHDQHLVVRVHLDRKKNNEQSGAIKIILNLQLIV